MAAVTAGAVDHRSLEAHLRPARAAVLAVAAAVVMVVHQALADPSFLVGDGGAHRSTSRTDRRSRRRPRRIRAEQTGVVRPVHHHRVAPGLRMPRDRLRAGEDLVVGRGLLDAHGPAHIADRHGVAAGGDRHQGVGRHDARLHARVAVRGPLAEGRQPLRREAIERPRVRRPVDPGVGHGAAPRLEPGVDLFPRREAPPGQGVALDVLHPALDLPLGLRPIGLAGARREAVVAREVLEDRVPADGARRPAEDLCPRIVIQTREGHAAEVAKGPLVAVEEHREPLVRIAIRETAARVAEGEHEEVDGLRPLADPHPQLPEVDLRLLAGAGLEADGRDGRPAALVPPRLHVPLDLEVAAAEAERHELPVQDGGIPADLRPAPRDELAKRLELLASPPALRAPAPQVPPALHGLLVHAQLAGDPLHPLAPLEPGQDLPHHVLLHHRPLRRSRWDRRRRYGKRLLLHTVPSSLGGGGNFRRRLRGEFYATDDTGR